MEENIVQPTSSVSRPNTSSTPPDSSSTLPQTPTVSPKKSKLFYFLVGLITLFILTVGAVSAVYISKSLKPKSNPAPVTKTSTSITSWKTWKNSLYQIDLPQPSTQSGYFISPDASTINEIYEYRKSSVTSSDPNRWVLVVTHLKSSQIPLASTDWNVFAGNFISQLIQIPVGSSAKIFNTKNKASYSFTRLKDMEIAGQIASVYNSNYSMQNGAFSRYVLFQNGDISYVLTFEWTNSSDEAIFTKALSTFKFISPTSTVTKNLTPTVAVKTTTTPAALPTSTPKPAVTSAPAPTATPVPANSGPPQVNISYPTEGQSISMDSSQQFCAVDSPVSNTVGLERKYNTSGAGWSSYSGVSSPFCYAPAEGSNTLELQYRNSNGYESSVYTIHFTFHRT